MNNFKNVVIVLLSLIIVIQSFFLIYFISYHRRPNIAGRVHSQAKPIGVLPCSRKATDSKSVDEWPSGEDSVPRAMRGRSETKEKAPRALVRWTPPTEVKTTPSSKPAPEAEAVSKDAFKPTLQAVGRIVLVLDDWGYNLKNRDFLTTNDYHVTISVLPFKAYSAAIAKLAYDKNKDVIVHIPMEPESMESRGLEEKTLLTRMSEKEIDEILRAALKDVPYARGISNHMGSKATQDRRLMKIIMGFLKDRGLIFLDSVVTSKTVCQGVAEKFGVIVVRRDVFIDNDSDPFYIQKQIMKLAEKAKNAGIAVGVGHDRPTTISVLEEMIPKLEKQGFEFVNLFEVIESRKNN